MNSYFRGSFTEKSLRNAGLTAAPPVRQHDGEVVVRKILSGPRFRGGDSGSAYYGL